MVMMMGRVCKIMRMMMSKRGRGLMWLRSMVRMIMMRGEDKEGGDD